jgi:hypothetical protein
MLPRPVALLQKLVVILKVLSLTKVPGSKPAQYHLRLYDSSEGKPGYVLITEHGPMGKIRGVLREAGLSEPDIDLLFAQAHRELAS